MNENNKKQRPAQPRPLTKKRSESKQVNARSTQRKSYYEEVSSGRLRGRKADILNLLRDRTGITCSEAARLLGTHPNCLTAALKQLETAGVLIVRQETVDAYTNKRVIVYELAKRCQQECLTL